MDYLPTLLLLSLSLPYTPVAAVIVPSSPQYLPPIIPGPGLPTLASLGLTSHQLYSINTSLDPTPNNNNNNPDKPSTPNQPSLLFADSCGGGAGDTAPIAGVNLCAAYLALIGDHDCRIPADHDQHLMCGAGDARIKGVDLVGREARSKW